MRTSPRLAMFCHHYSRRRAAVAVLALFTAAAHADTVWMKNGDRLTGEIRLLDAGKLTLATEYGGTMVLDWDSVQTLESDAELLIRDEALEREYLARVRRAEPGGMVVAAERTQRPVALAEVEQLMKPRPLVRDAIWTGTLDLGVDVKTASTRTEDYAADLDTEARHGRWRHKLAGSYDRQTDDHATTTHNYGASVSSDRFLGERFFWQGRALYKRDMIEELSRQMGIATGPGYQFWDNELGAFSLTAFAGRARYDYDDGQSDSFYAAGLGWNYKRYLSSQRFELFTAGELWRPLDNAADFSVDAAVGVRYRVTDWISWFLTYSRNQVSGGRESLNEKRLTTGLGMSW